MPKINEVGIEFESIGDNDLIPMRSEAGITGRIKKKNLVTGTTATSTLTNPILSNPNLISYWDSENVVTSDGLITQFTDRSSNNKNASQETNSLRCSLVNSVINSKPVARFTGSQYYSHAVVNDPLTIIAVTRNASSAAHRTLLGANNNNNNPLGSYYFKTNDPSGKISFVRSGLNNSTVNADALSFEKFYVQAARNYGSKLELFINNLLINSVSTSGNGLSIINPLIGAGYYNNAIVDYFLGDFHTIALFNAVLPDSLLIQYINYLRDYLKL